MRKEQWFRALGVAALAFAAGGTGLAQAENPALVKEIREIELRAGAAGPALRQVEVTAVSGAQGPGTFVFISSEVGVEGKTVKGKPYSAEGVTETLKVLADGTRIARQSTSKFFRDSEGRTRREQTLEHIGPWQAGGDAPAPVTVTIHDPVQGVTLILDNAAKSVRKIKIERRVQGGPARGAAPGGVQEVEEDVIIAAPAGKAVWVEKEEQGNVEVKVRRHEIPVGGGGAQFNVALGSDARRESLGTRTIEGVMAEGKRVTTTIPAGKLGNDRPITIVHETWYSPELEAVVMSDTKDPMSGDISYRLVKIQRGDPPSNLFEAPEGFKLEEGTQFRSKKLEIRHEK